MADGVVTVWFCCIKYTCRMVTLIFDLFLSHSHQEVNNTWWACSCCGEKVHHSHCLWLRLFTQLAWVGSRGGICFTVLLSSLRGFQEMPLHYWDWLLVLFNVKKLLHPKTLPMFAQILIDFSVFLEHIYHAFVPCRTLFFQCRDFNAKWFNTV